jgi:hypothetical protein
MLKFLILAVLAITSVNTFARGGDYKGNGGNVIYCPHKAIPYEVFDLFEARVAHGFKIEFAKGSGYREILENMFFRIARLNPSRADLYRAFLKDFETERRLMPNAHLEVLPGDEGWAPLEDGCERQQAIVQFKNLNISGYRYFVDADIWNKLDEQNKAALALHEFIYREGLSDVNDFPNSLGVRYFNGVLHSDLMPGLSLAKYIETLQKVGFQAADASGFPIQLHNGRNSADPRMNSISFWNPNQVAFAPLPSTFVMPTTNGKKATYRCRIKSGMEREHEIGFYENGTPHYLTLQCQAPVQVSIVSPVGSGSVAVDSMELNENGKISMILANPREGKIADALTLNAESYSIVRTLGRDTGVLELHFDWEGFPDVICMNQDTTGKQDSWRLSNNTRESFASSPLNSIAIGYDGKAYPYNYSCR